MSAQNWYFLDPPSLYAFLIEKMVSFFYRGYTFGVTSTFPLYIFYGYPLVMLLNNLDCKYFCIVDFLPSLTYKEACIFSRHIFQHIPHISSQGLYHSLEKESSYFHEKYKCVYSMGFIRGDENFAWASTI